MFDTFCKSLVMETNHIVKIIVMVIDMLKHQVMGKRGDDKAAANELVYRAVYLY